jgi:hypothetical protein
MNTTGKLRGRRTFAAALVAGLASVTMAGPAAAACFESGVGCTHDHNIPRQVLRTLSCDALWTVRNFMYDEKGYCFQTAKAQAVFSNEGCFVTNAALIPFNAYERTNIDRIASVEREKGC